MRAKFTKAGFARGYIVPALLMFAIPAVGVVFANHAQNSWDAVFLTSLTEALRSDPEVTKEHEAKVLRFYGENPPSVLCASGSEGHQALPSDYAQDVCGDYAQLDWIAQASLGSFALGLLSVLVAILCVALSFISRGWQYGTFVAGWNILRATSALQVVAQGFVAVMLSFWVTAFFFERYFVKAILAVGLLALAAVVLVVVAIFKRVADDLTVEGEILPRDKSPELWARVEGLCARLGTPSPQHIVGGIDDNFFVTEHQMQVAGATLEGRSLFVSLSLLKRLTKPEADAVLAHEMAHFSGGDTLYSKRLAPLLTRYATYLGALHDGGLSRPIYYFMLFYWSMFQISLGRTRRQRELRADTIAAEQTSPESVANALLKVSAYSSYRGRVEAGLFERNRAHSELNIAQSVAVGFTEYAQGPRLASDLEDDDAFPHPFDSHPALAERLANVGVQMPKDGLADVVISAAAQTWFNEIGDAERIETALWQAYEQRFRAAHEESLAYRYLPATPEERAHVERYFPPLQIAGKEGGAFEIDCLNVSYTDWEAPIAWMTITGVTAEEPAFRGKVLTIRYQLAGAKEAKATLPLNKLADEPDAVIAVFNRYYGRASVAKQQAEQAAS